jgi:hypothetical protein
MTDYLQRREPLPSTTWIDGKLPFNRTFAILPNPSVSASSYCWNYIYEGSVCKSCPYPIRVSKDLLQPIKCNHIERYRPSQFWDGIDGPWYVRTICNRIIAYSL